MTGSGRHTNQRTGLVVSPDIDDCNPAGVLANVAREFLLSKREAEVLAAAALGRCTKEIAFDLGITGKAVEYFWTRIYRKLNCRSQMEVMSFLFRRAASCK
jgi:DNA-binding NarL/FixJ family response regulator